MKTVGSKVDTMSSKVDIVSSKVDIQGMNVARLNRFILPGEKVLKRPEGLPPFPVPDAHQAEIMEKFLSNDFHKAATVSVLFFKIILFLFPH